MDINVVNHNWIEMSTNNIHLKTYKKQTNKQYLTQNLYSFLKTRTLNADIALH